MYTSTATGIGLETSAYISDDGSFTPSRWSPSLWKCAISVCNRSACTVQRGRAIRSRLYPCNDFYPVSHPRIQSFIVHDRPHQKILFFPTRHS
ncbi:hypothetical protein AB1N83_002719 [Pleurotus pulmonarius]